MRHQTTLTDLARLGFADLETSRQRLALFDDVSVVPFFAHAADPDLALLALSRLREQSPVDVMAIIADAAAAVRLIRVLGASEGLGDFLLRRPAELSALLRPIAQPLGADIRQLLVSIAPDWSASQGALQRYERGPEGQWQRVGGSVS